MPPLPPAIATTPHPAAPRRAPLVLAALLTLALLAWALAPRGERLQLVAKPWQRDIEIERRVEEINSGWCDELPADAQPLSRRLMVDPSGQRAAPAAHCRYRAPVWRALRSLRSQGEAAANAPFWDEAPLATLGPDERPGRRHERYELRLRQPGSGKTWACRLPQAQWQALRLGQVYRLPVSRHGLADCSALPGATV